MNWDRVQDNWEQSKPKVRQVWDDLTDDELDAIDGKHERLVGLLQAKYGYTKAQANAHIDIWLRYL